MFKCDYCGQEYSGEASQCPSCGKSFAEEPVSPPPPKSKTIAVVLAVIFGPLGLLYLGVEGLVVYLFVIGISIFVLPVVAYGVHMQGLGLLIIILARVASVSWVLHALARREPGHAEEFEAEQLLDEAIKLENVDYGQAIAKYEEVIQGYPGSAASKSAQTCIATLRANQK